MENMQTMLIGIDVCHSGPNSIVGLACSINKEMSQYYSEYLVQKKGREIVEEQMGDALKSAIDHRNTSRRRAMRCASSVCLGCYAWTAVVESASGAAPTISG